MSNLLNKAKSKINNYWKNIKVFFKKIKILISVSKKKINFFSKELKNKSVRFLSKSKINIIGVKEIFNLNTAITHIKNFFKTLSDEIFKKSTPKKKLIKKASKKIKIKAKILKKIEISNLPSVNTVLHFFKTKSFFYSMRSEIIFLKTKWSKVRSFCKNIVLFTLLLNIIVVNELHSIYYNISINYAYVYQLAYIFILLFCIRIFIKKSI